MQRANFSTFLYAMRTSVRTVFFVSVDGFSINFDSPVVFHLFIKSVTQFDFLFELADSLFEFAVFFLQRKGIFLCVEKQPHEFLEFEFLLRISQSVRQIDGIFECLRDRHD